ncbi:uncharacterized protein LOC124129160 [Haliotis rufescens]|uniref:uncharacterized protein LOC124129160 n=1 Tax=Haliotis rufescens TaxID=6454 RepID=UPI00201F2CF0|nr:uncharacterized protein LOC124129160 [Haliotis rufescens]
MEARARTFDCSPPYYHYNMGVPSIKLLSGVMMLLTFACPCLALVCNAGEEAVKTNGTSYECRTCPPGKYQPIANTTLADGFKCSKKICSPEARVPNLEDPTMGAVCVCDTTRGYYGEHPDNCRKRDEPCPTNSTLTKTGRCVCIDGHAENALGICVPVGPTSVGTTPVGTTPATTTGVFDNPVPQSQG